MRFLIIILLIAFLESCGNSPEKRFRPYTNELDAVFNEDTGRKLSREWLKPSDVFNAQSPAYKKLIDAGIINENSKVVVSGPDCITIINGKNQPKSYIEQKNLADTLIMFNGNEGKFACGINDLYTLNQDELLSKMHFSVYKIDAAMNLFIVSN